MPLLDRLRQELSLAGKTAQRALDEGKVRLDLYRARQSVDRFAQRLGYSVFRARKAGADLSPEEYALHMNNLTAAEAEVARLETLAAEAAGEGKRSGGPRSAPTSDAGTDSISAPIGEPRPETGGE
jgi:hypothetical protein